MKSDRGVTLVSLAFYIGIVLIVLSILATVVSNFQANISDLSDQGTNTYEIDKFNTYFLQEVKKQNNSISSITNSEIVFASNNKYTFRDGCIYLNDNIKVSENIENCTFTSNIENDNTVIQVTIKASGVDARNMEYVLAKNAYETNYENENTYVQ